MHTKTHTPIRTHINMHWKTQPPNSMTLFSVYIITVTATCGLYNCCRRHSSIRTTSHDRRKWAHTAMPMLKTLPLETGCIVALYYPRWAKRDHGLRQLAARGSKREMKNTGKLREIERQKTMPTHMNVAILTALTTWTETTWKSTWEKGGVLRGGLWSVVSSRLEMCGPR